MYPKIRYRLVFNYANRLNKHGLAQISVECRQGCRKGGNTYTNFKINNESSLLIAAFSGGYGVLIQIDTNSNIYYQMYFGGWTNTWYKISKT